MESGFDPEALTPFGQTIWNEMRVFLEEQNKLMEEHTKKMQERHELFMMEMQIQAEKDQQFLTQLGYLSADKYAQSETITNWQPAESQSEAIINNPAEVSNEPVENIADVPIENEVTVEDSGKPRSHQ
jgi:hypothetical protein